MTTGGIFWLSTIRKCLLLCSELPDACLSGVGGDDKAVLMAVSVVVGFIFVLLLYFDGNDSEVVILRNLI
jgi:hypothetical protein